MPSKETILYEERVELAAECYTTETGRTHRQLAKEYNVGRDAIRRRMHGISGKIAKKPTNRALNNIQEDTLLYWIY